MAQNAEDPQVPGGDIPAWLSSPVKIEAAAKAKRLQAAIDAGHPEWVDLPAAWVRARAAGIKFYFTGDPCSNGHLDVRHTDSRSCRVCNLASQRRSRERAKGAK